MRVALWVSIAALGLALAPGCTNRSVVGADAESAREVPAAGAERAIIRTAWIAVEVGDPPAALASATALAREYGGFVQESRRETSGATSLRMRIPSARLDEALDRLGALGSEQERSSTAEDVTEQIADLEASLANDRAVRDRLRALLARAKDVKEVLSVEEELTRLQTEIDRAEGRLKRFRSDVELSSLSATFRQQRILGPLGYALKGVFWVLEKLFVIRD